MLDRSMLAIMLDHITEVPADQPFPDTTLANLAEYVAARARIELDDPQAIGLCELLLTRARERAAAEHFQ